MDAEAFTPPDDDTDVDDWLEARAVDIAAILTGFIRTTFRPALAAWADTLRAAGDPQPLDVVDAGWATLIRDEVGDVLAGMHSAGALSAWIGGPTTPPDTFGARWADVMNDDAVEYQRTAVNRLVGASNALWGDVRDRTVYALEHGTGIEALKDEIEAVTGFVEQRAEVIARTETISAYNAGSYDGQVALGEHGPSHKQWSAAHDARTRPSHAAVDGTVVAFDATFDVGGHPMLRPHDPAGPASEVIQCRCRLKVFYPGDTIPDGTTAGKPADSAPEVVEVLPPGDAPADLLEWDSSRAEKRFGRAATDLGRLHRVPPDGMATTRVVAGGKATTKGGYFSPRKRSPKPRRVGGVSVEEYMSRMRDWYDETPIPTIRINDRGDGSHLVSFFHEFGHRIDYRPRTDAGRSISFYIERTTPATSALLDAARVTETITGAYSRFPRMDYVQYFRSPREIWARAYSQWAADKLGGEYRVALEATRSSWPGYQWTDAEFETLAPLVENVLRERGML